MSCKDRALDLLWTFQTFGILRRGRTRLICKDDKEKGFDHLAGKTGDLKESICGFRDWIRYSRDSTKGIIQVVVTGSRESHNSRIDMLQRKHFLISLGFESINGESKRNIKATLERTWSK